MAKGGKDEHKMLFDLQGKRRNVVKVVYAVLAVLMGLSLLLVIGPAPLADIFGTKNEVSSAAKQFEEQAERIEVKLAKDPENADLLANLTRAQVNAGNDLSERNETTGVITLTPEARQQFERASSTWSDYLEATDEPSATLAQNLSTAFFVMAEGSTTGQEAERNINDAAEAQAIVAEERPNLNSLTTYMIYLLFAFDYAQAKEVKKEAEALASPEQDKQISQQYKTIMERAKEFEAEQNERKKLEKEQSSQGGQENLENPLGGALGGGGSLSE